MYNYLTFVLKICLQVKRETIHRVFGALWFRTYGSVYDTFSFHSIRFVRPFMSDASFLFSI